MRKAPNWETHTAMALPARFEPRGWDGIFLHVAASSETAPRLNYGWRGPDGPGQVRLILQKSPWKVL